MRRLLLVAVGLAFLLTAITAEAGYLDRKNTFLIEFKAGYQLPRDENLWWIYDGGVSLTALAGYHITGNIALMGNATYRSYHIKGIYSMEPGGRLTNYTIGAGVKWNITQGHLIIPYLAGYGNLARYTNDGANGEFISNIPQAEGFFGIEFFLMPQFIADASLGYYKSFGEITVDILNYDEENPEGASKIPLEYPVEPEGIVLNFGFGIFL